MRAEIQQEICGEKSKGWRLQGIAIATPIIPRWVLVKFVRLIHVALSLWYSRHSAILCLGLGGWYF